jgi:lipoprotein-anchoring transpeptidase ErfK/SrfK
MRREQWSARVRWVAVLIGAALACPAPAAAAPEGLAPAKAVRQAAVAGGPVIVRRAVKPGFTLVDVSAGATVRAWPGGPSLGTLAATTPLGSPSWVWAVSTAHDGRWGRVLLPWRPNGQTGWLDLAGVRTVVSRWSVDVDLSQRQLSLLDGGRVTAAFTTGIGAPASPTPTGRFSVSDLVPTDPTGPYGSFAFGLSGHQPRLPAGWTGGDQLAIHGTNDPSTVGEATSAGCLRVSEHALAVLRRHLRLGTPVNVHL